MYPKQRVPYPIKAHHKSQNPLEGRGPHRPKEPEERGPHRPNPPNIQTQEVINEKSNRYF